MTHSLPQEGLPQPHAARCHENRRRTTKEQYAANTATIETGWMHCCIHPVSIVAGQLCYSGLYSFAYISRCIDLSLPG